MSNIAAATLWTSSLPRLEVRSARRPIPDFLRVPAGHVDADEAELLLRSPAGWESWRSECYVQYRRANAMPLPSAESDWPY